MTKAAKISRREERTERRQTQILDAARSCVRASGFHAASMSKIAAAAGMSVGHIYQYFESKEAIMIALCDADFEEFILHVMKLDDQTALSADVITRNFMSKIAWLMDYDRAALAVEVLAEAGRHPRVAEMVARVDHHFREAIRRMIAPVIGNLSPHDLEMRVEMLLLMVRGVVLHAGIHPDNDRSAVIAGIEFTLRGFLSPPATNFATTQHAFE